MIGMSSYAKKVVEIDKCGGENNKYDFVNEEHTSGLFNSYHKLTCWDPGTQWCVFSVQPYVDFQNDQNYIEGQIASGNQSGSHVIGNRTLTWSGTSSTCYTASIEII